MWFHVICVTFMYCIMQSYKIFLLITVEGKAIFGESVRKKYQMQKIFYIQKYILKCKNTFCYKKQRLSTVT